MGVVSAALRFAGVDLYQAEWASGTRAAWLAFVMYALLIIYLIRSSMKISQTK